MDREEYRTKAQDFMSRAEAALAEVFAEEDNPVLVVGLQFGEMGTDESIPNCMIASNLPICLVGEALEDMEAEAARQHSAFHGEDGEQPYMDTDAADVPEELREFAAKLADDLGVPVENIRYRAAVDTADLSSDELPDWLTGTDVAEALTGGDIAAAGLGLSDEDVAEVTETAARVEDEQEGKE